MKHLFSRQGFVAAAAALLLTGVGAARVQACDPPCPTYKTVVCYERITTCETRCEPYTRTVTLYDECGRCYKVTRTFYREVRVPVSKIVAVTKRVKLKRQCGGGLCPGGSLTGGRRGGILHGMNTAASPPIPTDEELAALAQRRDDAGLATAQDACRRLYERYYQPLLAFLGARVPRADREDALNEVWVRVWANLPDHFDGTHFRGWLYRIARNYCVDGYRRHRPEAVGSGDDWIDTSTLSLQELVEWKEVLEKCLKRLPDEQVQLVRARLDGEPYPELCRRLGLAPERGHRLFHQAKTQLQHCVKRATA